MIPITSLPLARKPRQLLATQGVHALSLEELVAIILGTGVAGCDVLALASQVTSYLLRGCTTVSELAQLPGVGMVKAAKLQAALQLPATLASRQTPLALCDAQAIYLACQDITQQLQEELVVFYLSIRSHCLARETVSLGTATASLLHPREVFRPAIVHNASHIVLAHNHPSGDPSPSQADKEVTARIVRAGVELGIEVVDHVVCAKHGFVSLAQEYPELFTS